MSEGLLENSLVLQALHAIRKAVEDNRDAVVDMRHSMDTGFARLDARVDETNKRLDEAIDQISNLRVFTVQKLTDLNAKADETNQRLGRLETSHNVLNERFGKLSQ